MRTCFRVFYSESLKGFPQGIFQYAQYFPRFSFVRLCCSDMFGVVIAFDLFKSLDYDSLPSFNLFFCCLVYAGYVMLRV
mgnify:CR=1 FL=1